MLNEPVGLRFRIVLYINLQPFPCLKAHLFSSFPALVVTEALPWMQKQGPLTDFLFVLFLGLSHQQACANQGCPMDVEAQGSHINHSVRALNNSLSLSLSFSPESSELQESQLESYIGNIAIPMQNLLTFLVKLNAFFGTETPNFRNLRWLCPAHNCSQSYSA